MRSELVRAAGLLATCWVVSSADVASACPNQELARVEIPGTTCNDGTPMVVGYRPATPGHEGEWLVVLEGGEACSGTLSCIDRIRTRPQLVSSAPSRGQACWPSEGIFDSSDLGDGHVVFARYCSSDHWTGRATDASLAMRLAFGRPFEMAGHQNLVELFSQLRDLPGMLTAGAPPAPEPTDIVFAGVSAGAYGMVQFVNELPGMFPTAQGNIRGISDSAVYMSAADTIRIVQEVTVLGDNPLTGLTYTAADRTAGYSGCAGGPCLPVTSLPYVDLTLGALADRYDYWNAQHDPGCLAGESGRRMGAREHVEACGDARVLFPYLEVPIFVFGYASDSNFMNNILSGAQLSVLNPPWRRPWSPAVWVPRYDSLVANDFRVAQASMNQADIRGLGGLPGNAAFMPRATGHTALLGARYDTPYAVPGGGTTTLSDQITNWIAGNGVVLVP